MIMIRWVVLAAILLAAGCAKPSTDPVVPAGCDPTADHLTWSPSTTRPVLTNASLLAGTRETMLLDEPFRPTVTGVDAPPEWLERLATSLQSETGSPVLARSPEPTPDHLGISAESGTQMVLWTGVNRVTAEFEVRCDPTVRGTFHGWSTATTGVVFCNSYQPGPPDAFGSLALTLCPAPTPAPSTGGEHP
ncbi:hypothetical protein M1L60_02450 [Actinoplanes sp. TRM 88003]|uniref:Uncharacterized protein n=1 Tax=Paractinoplanes aksuensis TaxID=2939490 RepID=A0ABT1DF50_9ACTN|nr:hypothetical protein [Actinoplanes aksuensis]MCO8269448.1 hypothetical protein [Actinoplanes aksuensis]